MDPISLYNRLEEENILYSNNKLYNTNSMIAHLEDNVAIIVDENKVRTTAQTNTALIHELRSLLLRSILWTLFTLSIN